MFDNNNFKCLFGPDSCMEMSDLFGSVRHIVSLRHVYNVGQKTKNLYQNKPSTSWVAIKMFGNEFYLKMSTLLYTDSSCVFHCDQFDVWLKNHGWIFWKIIAKTLFWQRNEMNYIPLCLHQ